MNIAIFASGGGSNAKAILQHFKCEQSYKVALLVSNNPEAGALDIADEFDVDSALIDKDMLYRSSDVLDLLKIKEIDLIALAGFLWWIPTNIIDAYRGRIINIHPSLLPKYGGKGMYGHHVHQAVKASGDTFTGLTIHHVTEEYDAGQVIVQLKCPVYPEDTPADIASRVLTYEHSVYPATIRNLLLRLEMVPGKS